ncbi:MAG: tRNA 2-thiouridine(34) synthase MnmA [Candidatus Moranbacteria bacterium RIFCSPHIGHO2_12_FULL_54_9]|nr:MAG: tRNA 2-thiouridine(34) synthase MnmA [Candidatus Moranbacteria bacterium RIFCSPHIGHO2_12_FULL_54_9]
MNIAVLVSGGVDSSVALRLLQEEGHTLTAFYLKIWLEDELSFLGECPWEDDLAYVRAVCEQTGVPLEIVPFQKEYWERVVGYTIAEVKAGRTPNPDMLCNAHIKFGAFYDFIAGKGFDKIATGHYAQVEEVICHSAPDAGTGSRVEPGIAKRVLLKMSPDPVKDQTYFLSQLTQAQLTQALFPIGKYEKREVRKLAEKFALPNAARKDSQGICFLGKVPFDKFLEYHLGKRPGKLIEYETGKVLGEHSGFWYFTVGQRRGIKLPGGPWYVVAKNSETNEISVSHGEHHELLARDAFIVGGLNWISGSAPEKRELQVKVRHGAKMYPATIKFLENGRLEVLLAEKDQGLAAGQFAVFYDGEYCLGGGVIL